MKMANITLTKTGTLYFNNTRIEWSALGSAISSEIQEEPQTLVVIRADRSVLYDDIVRIMDTARGAGTKRLALAVFEKR
jgi:biopolymer transport protein ExbD